MKYKHGFILMCIILFSQFGFAQTATNFNVNDCNNNNYNLFNRLDAGKVVVIAWVMPCATCIGPAATAYTEVQNLLVGNPGKIDYLLVDDIANTNCSTLATWGNNYGITNPKGVFSDAAISMYDYGTPGMPKVTIICGATHSVVFNENDGLDNTVFKNALNSAIQCSFWPNAISENLIEKHQIKLSPNPSQQTKITIDYSLQNNAQINIGIYALDGQLISTISEMQAAGKHAYNFSTDGLAKGLYLARLDINGATTQLKFIID